MGGGGSVVWPVVDACVSDRAGAALMIPLNDRDDLRGQEAGHNAVA